MYVSDFEILEHLQCYISMNWKQSNRWMILLSNYQQTKPFTKDIYVTNKRYKIKIVPESFQK